MSRLEELENKRQAFNNVVEGLDYGRAVTIGSYTGALRSRVEELESRYEKAVDESEIFQREHLQARKRARKYKQALEEIKGDIEMAEKYGFDAWGFVEDTKAIVNEALKGDTP